MSLKIRLKYNKVTTPLSNVFLIAVVLILVFTVSTSAFLYGVSAGMIIAGFYHLFRAIEQGFKQGYREARDKYNQQTDLPCDDCWKIPERHCCWWNEEDEDS